jgi:branched-chain amino acid transport system permease protein
MRFVMKKSYWESIRLFEHTSTFYWYLALVLGCILLPFAVDEYILSQFTFVCIYGVGAVGLMLLAGYTGQVSLGHSAFFAIGSYASAIMTAEGVPFIAAMPLAGLLAAVLGILVGIPVLRLTGLYLSIATLAFAFIIEEVLARWEGLTRGNLGYYVDFPSIGSLVIDTEAKYFYLAFVVLAVTILLSRNLLRSTTGRAMIAIRDSEVAAQAMGINLTYYKILAFAVSAFFTGIAGSLYAHKLMFINPESYTLMVSIEFLMMIIVGGLGSLHGAVFGAAFFIMLPQVIVMTKEYMPAYLQAQTGLESMLFGLAIILFILFEPMGLYGRWLKIKFYFEMFPLYRKDTFKREKSFQKVVKQ